MAMVISRKYEVVGQLGQGGMGLVYKVRHTALDSISALKVLPAYLMENQDMVNRFYREARVMARLNHPNIVKVLDIERDESLNLYYFVMEYIEGVTLGKHLRDKGPLALPEILTISRQVADALGYAHSHTPPIIHRDIKPANIMIEDRTSRVVVMDFGIAKELGDGDSTKTGMVIGTLKYASPEQLRHEPLDGSADVYSLGMVMYEMYTGKQFFGGLDEHAVLGKVLYEKDKENEPRFDRRPPAAFADLLTRAIAKNRTRRYRNMRELLQALEVCRNLSSEDDETGTLILQGLGGEEKKPLEPSADEDIEDQIRKLEEERERRRVVPLQTQAREARERATREGAADWTATLLQEGQNAEERGAKSLREREFTAAQQAFEEAVQLFERAVEEAKTAAARHKATQAKDGMVAAKDEADHYGARENDRTRYAQALSLQAQAEGSFSGGDFQHAVQLFSEAERIYDVTRDAAYREVLKREATTAQSQAVAVKSTAEARGAAQFATLLFREAAEQEQRANAALSHQEYTQARELFLGAAQKYEQAEHAAVVEQKRQEAVTTQRQAKEAQRQAEAAHAPELAPPSFQQAALFQKQGDSHEQTRAYEKATQSYLQARERYQHAIQEAELEQEKQATTTTRQQLQHVQAQADRAGAKKRIAPAYTQAQQLVTQGQESERQQEYREARDRYTQATQRFQQLAREATALAARERADTARQQMAIALQGSEALQNWAQASWMRAQEGAQQAEQAYQRQEYGHAAELYVQATQAYLQARTDAEREQLQQETRDAQQQAQAARAQAETHEAQRYAIELWREGVTAQKEAEQQLQAKEPRAAIQRYWRAAEVLTKAAEAAQHEHGKRTAAAAQQRANDARQVAEKAGAGQRFAADFAQAVGFVEQAEQEVIQQNFAQAVSNYQRALDVWQRLAGDAFQEAEKERAATAREQVAEARNRLTGLREWLGPKSTEAQRREGEAESAWKAKRYTEAAELSQRVTQLYGDAQQEAEDARKAAEIERQRQRALDARQQAEEARVAAQHAEAQQYATTLFQQATQTLQQAEQHLHAQHWNDASQVFAQARSLWSQAEYDAQQEKARQATVAIHQRLDAARAAAEDADAHTRFTQDFARAQRLTEQGQQAEARQDFAQAIHLYEQALQQLLRLRREADIQAARDEADAARRQLVVAKENANALKQWAKALWDTAQKHEAEAERTFKGQDYEAALTAYLQASATYTEAAVIGERERLRQEALQAEKHATAAKKKAEEADAPRYAATEFEQSLTTLAEASRAQQKLEFVEAIRLYRQAEELFTQAIVAAQHEQAKQQAMIARRQAEASCAEAVQAGAERRLATEFAQAQQLLTQAQTDEERQEFTAARREYEQAQQQFAKLIQAVQQQIVRAQAESAKQKMLEAKQTANSLAPNFAATLWKEGQTHESEAEKAWKAQAYDRAREHYARAEQSYARARIDAEIEEQRQRAVAASQDTKDRQKEAETVRAAQYAGDPYRRAQAIREQAESAVATKKFDEAVVLFAQASALFRDAAQTAQLAYTKQLAVVTREKANAAQAEAQAANSEEFVPGQYVEAMALWHEAEQAFTAEEFVDAHERFEHSAVRWLQIRQEAEVAQQKHAVEVAKTQAYELREQTRASKGRQKRSAEKAITTGDQFLQQRRYAQARASYEEAISLLSALQPAPVPQSQDRGEDARTLIEPARQSETRLKTPPVTVAVPPAQQKSNSMLVGAVTLVVAVVLGLYLSREGEQVPPKGQQGEANIKQAEAERLKAEQAAKAQAEAERLKAEQAAKAQAEAERLKAEQTKIEQAKAERLKAEQAAKAQAEAERLKAEQTKIEQAKAERLKAEQAAKAQAEAERLKAEQAKIEQARIEQAKAERLKAEQAEAERLQTARARVEPLSEQEAKNWLETTYRQAWQNKNVDTLIQLGEVSSQDASKLRDILSGYKNYSVSLRDISVRNDGNRAIVRFTRVDTIDGKTLLLPPKEVTLEKGDGGRIARRR